MLSNLTVYIYGWYTDGDIVSRRAGMYITKINLGTAAKDCIIVDTVAYGCCGSCVHKVFC